MKKSIVALGAALVAGAAHAVIVQPITNDAVATQMAQVQAGGIGHVLVTPYFSTANGNTTLLSLVNTDSVNGKAVKVRFRGAANSDDILDFTVLMSPSDVWTASVERGPDGIVLPRGLSADDPIVEELMATHFTAQEFHSLIQLRGLLETAVSAATGNKLKFTEWKDKKEGKATFGPGEAGFL